MATSDAPVSIGRVALTVRDHDTVARFYESAIGSAGISMNSLWSVHAALASGMLVRVLPGLEVDDRSTLWLVYPKSNVLTAKVRVFIDFLVERIGRAPPWLPARD